MPANTAPLGFPYPLGSDPVADGDNAIRGLAESVDDYLVGTGAACVMASGNTDYGSYVRRKGSVGLLNIVVETTVPLDIGAYLLTVPAAYAPSDGWYGDVRVPGANGIIIVVLPTGQVQVREAVNAGVGLIGSLTYPLP